MTTSFAYTIRGHLLAATHAQAAGMLLALGTLAAGAIALFAVLTGRRPALNWYRINPMHAVWVFCGLFVVAWGIKILLFLVENGQAERIRF
jgi:cytosine/adenosine deaminase-related metal-dependent hydrolase